MAQNSKLETSYRQQQLWPSIHAAVDVYLRRRACKADAYELIWRLVHVWECCTITLAAAASARIREMDSAKDHYRSIREKCYGLSRNEADGKLEKSGQGALDGSIDKWIEILFYVSNIVQAE